MADLNPLSVLKGLGEAAKTVQQGILLMDEANNLRKASPELQADFIVRNLNNKDKIGVHFEREGTVAVGKMNATQINNLMKVEAQLTDAEREKFFGGKIDMNLDITRDRTQPDGPINGGVFTIDAKKIQNWNQFSQAFDYFNGKGGSAPALKAAITTGEVKEVRKVLGTEAPAVAAGQEAPAASAPAASAPEVTPAKKKPWDKILDKLPSLPKGTGTPAPTSGEGGPQSKVDQPIDVAALTAKLGLKAPAADAQTDSPTATYGGTAPVRSTDRNVG